MIIIIARNEGYLIEVETWGYRGDREAATIDAKARLAETGIRLGDWTTARIDLDGGRVLLYSARPFFEDTPESQARDLSGVNCRWGHTPDDYGRCRICGQDGC